MDLKFSDLTKLIKGKILSDRIVSNIILMSTGTLVAQLLNIIAQPIITRLYTPSQYGALTILTSLLLVFRVVTLRFDIAIPIPKVNEDAHYLVLIALLSTLFFSGIIFIILLFYGSRILNILNVSILESYWLFIPIGILFQGAYLVFQGWMYRKKNFEILRRKEILQSVSANTLKIIFGILNFGTFGIISSKLVSIFFAGFTLSVKYFSENKNTDFGYNYAKFKTNIKKYKDYPLYQTPSSLSLHLRNQLPILFLTPLYGPVIAGFYGLSNQIIKLPMNLIGISVMNVFFAEVASIGKDNPIQIKELADTLLKKLFILGLPPVVIIVLFGPYIFGFIFGSEWIQAGEFASILSLYVYANFVFSPISRIFEVFEEQKQKLFIDVLSLLTLVIIFAASAFLSLPINILLMLYTATMIGVYTLTYYLSVKILHKEIRLSNEDK